MQGVRRALRVRCYEISQIPAEKTDYKFTLNAQVVNQEGIEDWLWSIHTALANPLPRLETVIWCPVPSFSDETSEGCLCRCVRVIDEGDRPFLRTQAVIVALRDLIHVEANPMSLYDSDVWQQMRRKRSAPVEAVLQSAPSLPAHERPSQELTTAVARALVDSPRQSAAYDLTNDGALALMRAALPKLGPRQLARASFAVGVPDGVDLPTNPAVVIHVRDAKRTPAHDGYNADVPPGKGTAGQVHSYASPSASDVSVPPFDQRARDFINEMTRVAQWFESNNFPALWRERWWNQCQDMITCADVARRARNAGRLLGRIESVQEGLVSEVSQHLSAQDAQQVSRVVREQTRTLIHPIKPRQRPEISGKFGRGWSPAARLLVIFVAILLVVAVVVYAVQPLLLRTPASSESDSTSAVVNGAPNTSPTKSMSKGTVPTVKGDNSNKNNKNAADHHKR